MHSLSSSSIDVQSSFEVIVKALKYVAIDTKQATEAETQRWKRVATVMKAYGVRLSEIKRRYAPGYRWVTD